ncbi:MAG: SoxR reducing system RseC family protein [bacterium]|nr:SoxR reducing system RseC family protein [bacterium]
MDNSRMVSHDGKVITVNGSHVQVKILSQSACAGCHAKSRCGGADMQEKIIDAVSTIPLSKGDMVTVNMEEKMGWTALFFGFILPFIVMVTVLFVLHALGRSETEAALYGLGSLVPYYLGLYIFRKKIEKHFIFTAEKKTKI